MRSTEKINFQSARGEAAKESVQEMVSKPWQNYFDDIEGPNVPVTLLEGNVKNRKVKIDTQNFAWRLPAGLAVTVLIFTFL